jgi:hypothetical protein
LIVAETAVELNNNEAAISALNKVRAHNSVKFTAKYDDYVLLDFEKGGLLGNESGNIADALKKEILLEKFCSIIGLPTYQDVLRTKNLIGVPIKGQVLLKYHSVFYTQLQKKRLIQIFQD